MTDSRQFVPELVALADPRADGRVALLAPSPGLWRDPPAAGALIRPGDVIGTLEILGVHHRLRAPEGGVGVVRREEGPESLARRPVDHRAALLTLDPEALTGTLVAEAAAASASSVGDGTLVFAAPSSGRFYHRPSPDKPAFVEVGQVIERGQTVGVLEVMKTFTRINYDDPKLPSPAKVVALVAKDQEDLGRGDPILHVEAAD